MREPFFAEILSPARGLAGAVDAAAFGAWQTPLAWSVVGMALACGALVVLLLRSRRQSRAIRRLADAIQTAATGDSKVRLPRSVTGADRRLAQGWNDLLRHMHYLAESKSRLTQEIVLRNHFELKLRQAKESADRSAQAKRRFLADLSSELRSSLNSIVGDCRECLEDLERSGAGTSRRRILAVHNEAERLLRLTGGLLEGDSLPTGEIELQNAPFDLRQIPEAIARGVEVEVRRKGLAFSAEIDDDVPCRLIGDAKRLRQVLSNLVVHAVKFTEHGSITVRVSRIASDRGRAVLRFSIIDTGTGIEKPRLDTIFHEAAYPESRRTSSSGIGATVAKQLVERMGGRMGVSSHAGEGNIFWFEVSLEIETQSAETPEVPAGAAPTREAAASPRRGRVLVAEDDATSRTVIRMQLERLGVHVDTVDDGEQAVQAAADASYDMILMDLNMPGLDGFAASQRIRQGLSAGRGVPIVALTAGGDTSLSDRCREAGMAGLLTKPARRRDLATLLDRWLPTGAEAVPREIMPSDAQAAVERSARSLGGAEDRIIDYEAAVHLFGGNRQLLEAAIRRLRQSSHEMSEQMRAAHAGGDAERLRATAHKLKGGASCLTVTSVADIAASLEEKASSGDLAGIDPLFDRLDQQLERLESYLENELTCAAGDP